MKAYLYAGALAVILLGAWALWLNGYNSGADDKQAEYDKALADARSAAIKRENELLVAYDKIAHEYERGKKDAQAVADRVVADLRSEQLRLRQRWTCPAMPTAPTSAGEPDAAERDREESSGRIVRAAVECDRQVTQLQAIIRADRK